ncbi:MAG: hypothetical protein ACPGPI_01950 [Longimicrobiales bacterium]
MDGIRSSWASATRTVLMTVVLVASPAFGSAQVDIRSDVDTTLVTVGDRITLTVRVTHPEAGSVLWPDSLDLSPFEVLAVQVLPPESLDGARVSSTAFQLTAFELGELEIPAFDVEVVRADGSRETLRTDRFGVEVVTVGQDETGDIREIRGPLMIPVSVLQIASWLLMLLLAVAAGAWGYRRWARSRAGQPVVAPGPPPRPPHEIALEALDRLEASELLIRGEVKKYHIEASGILRRYVEARFRVTALEMTTWEILDGLARVGAGSGFRGDLRRFLDQCDLVKFAKVLPAQGMSHDLLQLGRDLVIESMNRANEGPGGEETISGGSTSPAGSGTAVSGDEA